MTDADVSDIRKWAKDNGHDVGERGRITAEVREAYERSLEEPDLDPPPGIITPITAERKPKTPSLGDRVKGMAKSKVTTTKRVPADDMLGGAWQLVGQGLVMSGADIPVGRVMSLQAPTAGAMLDKAVAGSFLDRLAVQPLARAGTKGASLGALVGPPLLVGMIERNPALYEPLKPILKMMLSAYLVEMAPALKEMRKKEEQAMAALGEIMEEFGAEEGEKMDLDMLLASFFAFPERQAPDEEEAEMVS